VLSTVRIYCKNIGFTIMADFSDQLGQLLPNFDEELLCYLVSVIEGMSVDERKNFSEIKQAISPFLLDTGYVSSDKEADEYCRKIAVSNGGSGYAGKGAASGAVPSSQKEDLILLSAPVKMIDHSGLAPVKHTYGGAVFTDISDNGVGPASMATSSNSALDISSVATTQKQLRKQRKDANQLSRSVIAEQLARAAEQEETARVRMAAIKASRALGKQAFTGVSLDRVSLPHPSGAGDLLSEITLSLTPGRRYGLIGRNGAGKSTLLRALANYQFDGLTHLKIMMVDQHVEGDNDTAIQWLLRADVERTSLLEDEARLMLFIHDPDSAGPLPPDLVGVNLEVALAECFDRMDAIGVSSAEARAVKILTGLGFDHKMMHEKKTAALSGGWVMRAALGAALFVKPNLLLLDEPTNHLDLHALLWLEAYLIDTFIGIAVVVSHDKHFLDDICTDIIELRSILGGQKKTSLEQYSGDFSTFAAVVEERSVAQARARLAYEKEKDKLKEFISREGKKFDTPQHQAQRKMKMKQLEALVEVEAVEEDAETVFNLPPPYAVFDPSDALIGISCASFSWTEEEPPLFEDVDFSITATSRVAIMGRNGCGALQLCQVFFQLSPR
jgi:ATP-binding cassette subfamily F protein 3